MTMFNKISFYKFPATNDENIDICEKSPKLNYLINWKLVKHFSEID